MRRKILISLTALAVLFAGVIGLAWYLLQNESFLKAQLSKYTLKHAGRELRFDGPLAFRLGATTTLEGKDIHFANAGWSKHPEMVSVGRIFISFDLSTLFDDRPVLPEARLEDCSVYVERNDSGKLNWDFSPQDGPVERPEKDDPGRRSLPIWVKDLAIRNCEVHVSSFNIEEPLHLQLESLEMQHGVDTRWAGKGSGSLNGMPLSVNGWFAPFDSVIYGGPLEQELEFTLGKISLKSSGTLKDVRTGTGANITARLQGPEIENILRQFEIPLFSEGDFDFSLKLNTEGDTTTIDLDGDLGSLQATMDGELDRLVGPTSGNVNVAIDGPNLGALAQVFGIKGVVEEAFSHRMQASLDEGLIHFKNGSLKTPRDHLQLGGHFSLADGFAGTELDLGFHTDEVGRWNVAPEKRAQALGPLDFDAKLRVDDKKLIAIQGRATQGETTLDVKGTLGTPDAIRPDLEISLNSPNPGALASAWGLPIQPVSLDARIQPDGEGLAFGVKDGNLGAIQLELNGRIADLKQPMGITGNFDISLPRLRDISFLVPGSDLPEAPFSAAGELVSEKGRVNLKGVRVDLADNRATIDGHINLDERYAGSKLSIDLDIKNAREFGLLFGRQNLPDQPVKLSASVEPAGKGLAFRINEGTMGDLKLDVNGRIADLDQPTGVDAEFDLRLGRFSDIAFLFPGREFPAYPFAASGRLVNEKARTRLDKVQLSLGEISASVEGELRTGNAFQLAVKASGPDVSVLNPLIATELPAKAFSASTDLQGIPSEFELRNASVELGQSRASGNLKIGLGDITLLHGNIVSPYVDASHWYPGEDAGGQQPAGSGAETGNWMFDETPVFTSKDKKLDIDLDLKIETLVLGNTTVKAIDVQFRLNESLLELSPFSFGGTRGGSYDGNFSLDGTSGTPTMHLDVNGQNVHLGLMAAPGQDPQTYPPIEIAAKLTGAGATRREMASSLDGKIRIYEGAGQLARAGMDFFFSDFLSQLFTQLNPFSKTSEYTELDCAVFAAEIKSGLVEAFPLIVHTKQLTILSEGTVDLNTEKINLSFNTKPRTGLGLSPGMVINPLIKVGGRLTAPTVEIDPAGTLSSGGLAVATVGVSLLVKSMSDRFMSSRDPCGEARKELEKIDAGAQ